jgi:hypothetical protein
MHFSLTSEPRFPQPDCAITRIAKRTQAPPARPPVLVQRYRASVADIVEAFLDRGMRFRAQRLVRFAAPAPGSQLVSRHFKILTIDTNPVVFAVIFPMHVHSCAFVAIASFSPDIPFRGAGSCNSSQRHRPLMRTFHSQPKSRNFTPLLNALRQPTRRFALPMPHNVDTDGTS